MHWELKNKLISIPSNTTDVRKREIIILESLNLFAEILRTVVVGSEKNSIIRLTSGCSIRIINGYQSHWQLAVFNQSGNKVDDINSIHYRENNVSPTEMLWEYNQLVNGGRLQGFSDTGGAKTIFWKDEIISGGTENKYIISLEDGTQHNMTIPSPNSISKCAVTPYYREPSTLDPSLNATSLGNGQFVAIDGKICFIVGGLALPS